MGAQNHRAKRPAATPALSADEAVALAQAAIDSGREEQAVSVLAAAAARASNDARLWQWLALLHRALDHHEEALAAFAQAARLAPADALLAHSLARTTLEAGRPAMALFDEALRLGGVSSPLLLGRAAARCALGDHEGAIAEVDRMLAANPRWLQGHELAAQLCWMTGRRDSVVETIERALMQAPRDPGLWLVLLTQLIHAGRYEQVLSACASARGAIGEHLLVLANEATALSELGRNSEADVLFARLAGSGDISIAVRHLRHLLRTGRAAEAARIAERLVDGPDANLIWPYLSLAWRMTGDERWRWLEGPEGLIGIFDIAAAVPPLDELAERLRGLHHVSAQPIDQSARGGTQTDGNLFQRIEPVIRQLRAGIADAVRQFIAALPDRDEHHPFLRHRRDRPIRFSGAWSVRLTGSGHHASHNHPAGWISSAFYVALPAVVADASSEAGWLRFGAPPPELGLDLQPLRTIQPQPGRLVLFPSTMWHDTVPFPEGERITVAFDVAPPRA